MVLRRKNLLDAFRNAQHGASPSRPIIESPRATPSLGKALRTATDEPRPSRERQLLLGLLFVLSAALAGVWWWKSRGPTPVQAGAPTQVTPAVQAGAQAGPTAVLSQPAPVQQGRGGSPHDKAFLDTANRFTVRAGQYSDDPRGRAEALAHYDYLTDQGLPCVMPVRSGKYLILCVGYAPKLDKGLQGLRDQLAGLRGPKGAKKPPFATAWVDNIDNVVQRSR